MNCGECRVRSDRMSMQADLDLHSIRNKSMVTKGEFGESIPSRRRAKE